MKFTDGLWLQISREVAEQNSDIEFEDRIVDNLCMQLVQRPEEYDVLVLPNLYGDIVSDLAAGLIGGLGLAPGGNFGTEAAVFEPTHGSAPKYAGQNKVNLMAMMLSGVLMLRHLDEGDAADRLEGAIADVIAEGKSVTYDMKPSRDDPSAVGTRKSQTRSSRSWGCESDERTPESHGRRSRERRRQRARAARRDYADVVVVDIKEGLPEGKALDINQAGAVLGYEPNVTGSTSYEPTAGSEVVVITAGLPRQPGMSRDDLVTTNEKIVGSVTEQVVAQSPDAVLIVVSNPLDAMCHVARSVSGFPKERVFGQAGILTPRFRAFIAWETGAGQGRAGGRPGRARRPDGFSGSATTVGGVPPTKLVSAERIAEMVERTAKAAARSWSSSARRRGTRPVRPPRRWSTRSCSTRSGCSHARRTSRASTGSTGFTWAYREARRTGDRGDHRARPHRRRAAALEASASASEVVGVLSLVAR